MTPPLPHLSVVLFVLQSTGVAGAESRAIGISVCPTAIISFGLTTHLLFTFTPEIGQAEAGEVAGAGDDGHENELLFFFLLLPFTEWTEENVVSYLVRAWLTANRGLMAKSAQSPFCFSLECEKKRLFNYHIFAYI